MEASRFSGGSTLDSSKGPLSEETLCDMKTVQQLFPKDETVGDTAKESVIGNVLIISNLEKLVTVNRWRGFTHICIGNSSEGQSYLVTVRPPDLVEHVVEKKHSCNECDYKTPDRNNLLTHIKGVHKKDKRHKCNECEFSTTKRRLLKRHIDSVHTTHKPFACLFCDFRCSILGYLKRHLRLVHSDFKPFSCNMCEFTSTNMRELKEHMSKEHALLHMLTCSKCNYVCSSRVILRKHAKDCHKKASIESPENAVRFYCSYCNNKFKQKQNLERHIRLRHTREGLMNCDECDFKTTSQCFLDYHILDAHKQIRPYICQICNFSSARLYILKQHVKMVHLKERPHVCRICGFKGALRSHLKRHIAAVHLKYKPNACELCPFKTLQKSNLIAHKEKAHNIKAERVGRKYGSFIVRDVKLDEMIDGLEGSLTAVTDIPTDLPQVEMNSKDEEMRYDPPGTCSVEEIVFHETQNIPSFEFVNEENVFEEQLIDSD